MASLACCIWWLVAGLLVGTLLAWLLHALFAGSGGGEGRPGRPTTPTSPGPTKGRAQETRSARSREDQLEAIEGIGPKIASIFRERDIQSFDALARKTPEELRSMLEGAGRGFELARTDTWPRQARLLADGDIVGFVNLIQHLRGGVEPSTRA